MTSPLRPAPVGRLTEPTRAEREAFLAEMRLSPVRNRLSLAHGAAEHRARLADQAAVYTRYDANVPNALRHAIEDADDRWNAHRPTPPGDTPDE